MPIRQAGGGEHCTGNVTSSLPCKAAEESRKDEGLRKFKESRSDFSRRNWSF